MQTLVTIPEHQPYALALAKITYRATSDVVGDGNYFRQTLVSPYVNPADGTLVVTHGWGARRHWGSPRCQATLQWFGRLALQVEIHWRNKHYWGDARYYFLFEDRTLRWKKVSRLSVLQRLAVVEEAKLVEALNMPSAAPTPELITTLQLV